jgi:hypothetical protein
VNVWRPDDVARPTEITLRQKPTCLDRIDAAASCAATRHRWQLTGCNILVELHMENLAMDLSFNLFSTLRNGLMPRLQQQNDNLLMLEVGAAASRLRQTDSVSSLGDVGFSVYSQFGEDGILEWLCQRIPGLPRRFIEFGVSDYQESNTRFLLKNRNWRGLIMDSSAENIRRIHADAISWRHDALRSAHSSLERISTS